MLRRLSRLLGLALILAVLGTVASDYAVFDWRQRQGASLGAVTVRQFLATPLKGGREQFDSLGEVDQPCVRALLPHQQMPPCWWVRRHKDRWTRS